MRIYVAGKWQEKSQVKQVQIALVNVGHEITHDWTIHEMGAHESQQDTDVQIGTHWYDPDELAHQALGDLRGVQTCEAIVICAINPHKYSGTLTEMGIALGCGRRVLIIGDCIDGNIFTWLPEVKVYPSLAEVIDALRG